MPAQLTPQAVVNTVTIACKIPNGLVLQCHTMEKTSEPVMGGGFRDVMAARPHGQPFTVFGPAKPYGEEAKAPITGGYALTFGIPKDFWDRWVTENAQHPAVVNHMIFAHDKPADAQAEAREKRDLRSGMEPLKQAGDPRIPKSTRGLNIEAAPREEA